MITCEAENLNGIDRDSLLFKSKSNECNIFLDQDNFSLIELASSIINQNTLIPKSTFDIANDHWTTVDKAKNQVSSNWQISSFIFIVISVLAWLLNDLILG